MKAFYKKVLDYIYDKRLEMFQAMFYSLYDQYGRSNSVDEFLKTWFDRYALKKLVNYFPFEDIADYYYSYVKTKRKIIKSYVTTYWSFYNNPYIRSSKLRESLEFFGMRDLDLKQLKKTYRNLIKKYHPDVYHDRKEAHKKMLLINYHYQVIISCLLYMETKN